MSGHKKSDDTPAQTPKEGQQGGQKTDKGQEGTGHKGPKPTKPPKEGQTKPPRSADVVDDE